MKVGAASWGSLLLSQMSYNVLLPDLSVLQDLLGTFDNIFIIYSCVCLAPLAIKIMALRWHDTMYQIYSKFSCSSWSWQLVDWFAMPSFVISSVVLRSLAAIS